MLTGHHLQAVVNLAKNTSPKRQKLTTSAAVLVEGGTEAALGPSIVNSKFADPKLDQSLGPSAVRCTSLNLDRTQKNSNQKANRAAASGSSSRAGSGGCQSAGSGHNTSGKAAASGGSKRSRGSNPVPKPAVGSNQQQHRACSKTAGTSVPAAAAAAAGHGSAAGGLAPPVALPTPRRRSRLVPAGLLAAAGPEARPAQTVMEVSLTVQTHWASTGSTRLGKPICCVNICLFCPVLEFDQRSLDL